MRHDGTICKEEVQCQVYWKTMRKSRLESNRDEWTSQESNRENDIEEMKKYMNSIIPDDVTTIMTQLSLKSGLRQWGSRAYDAAESEMKQLHLRDTFNPMHWSLLTRVQRLMTLESHMFLKEKRDGKIKGRTVAGGNKQRNYISKEDVSSPTVTTESVLLSCIIDAKENRDVAVIDIPNAFIQTRVEDEKDRAIIRLRGVLVEVLENIAPDVYGPYITKNKKRKNSWWCSAKMQLDITNRGIVKISMLEFVDEILAGFEKEDPHSGGQKPALHRRIYLR
jgi:hypothetical protein